MGEPAINQNSSTGGWRKTKNEGREAGVVIVAGFRNKRKRERKFFDVFFIAFPGPRLVMRRAPTARAPICGRIGHSANYVAFVASVLFLFVPLRQKKNVRLRRLNVFFT